MFGPQQNLAAKDLESLGQKISDARGEKAKILRVYQCGSGANANTHYVLEVGVETYIGLKVCSRGVANGSEKERLVADVADLLDAPANCKAMQITVMELPALVGKPANAIVWLRGAKSLDKLTPPEIADLKVGLNEYLRQYGEWMCLGLLLGVSDRHPGSWAWAQATRELTMIDNEECLNQVGVQNFYPGLDFVCDRPPLKRAGSGGGFGVFLAEGLRAMQEKFRGRETDVRKLLRGYPFAAQYNSKFMPLSPDEFVETVFGELA